MTDRNIRVAFNHMPAEGWTAGSHYLKNLFLALRSLEDSTRPQIALLVGHNVQAEKYASLSPYIDLVLYHPILPTWLRYWERQRAQLQRRMRVLKVLRPALSVYLQKQKVDALFTMGTLGPQFAVPYLAWIPDFQHLHLPEMFSEDEIRNRNRGIFDTAHDADIVVLSSNNARQDFERFVPYAASKARVLSFVAQVPDDIYTTDPDEVCQVYDLPKKFIYLPNQFWKHKNHEVVLKALSLLRPEHPEIVVVCTGNTNEYRDPLYFSQLLARVSSLGLRNNFIVLGMVPHKHLFQLMRQSLAVLQPSLFEGWSTTVEEVKSVGKKIILSDIAVHQEQAPPEAVFFRPNDEQQLADCMISIYAKTQPGPDEKLELLAKESLPDRTRAFAQTFIEILTSVIE
ncbi:MAG: glycosyltransferase family 4 protein [Anaerolineae bacterium]|nr:glycosyltransferase family 4 protein [Anaerolineae bacterium]